MGFDHAAAKQTISVTLNGDLLCQAGHYTGDLSTTLEMLLAEFVRQQEACRSRDDAALAQLLNELDAIHEKYGLLSEEYQDF